VGADPGYAHGPHREVGGAVVDLDAEGRGRLVPVPVPEGVHRFPRERFHIGAEDVRLGGRENELEGRRIDPGESVQFIQQGFDVEDKLKAVDDSVNYEALEAAFVDAAASFSDRKGISYSAWREAGVAPAVLKSAAIRRTRRA